MRKHLSTGMGTRNFITEVLDIFAVLDRDRKQMLINYSHQLAAEQRAERREEQLAEQRAEQTASIDAQLPRTDNGRSVVPFRRRTSSP